MEVSTFFEGTNQYARCAKTFMALVKDTMNEMKTIGVGEGGLGAHFCRKGVATMVTSVCTVYPSIVLVCARTEWVMGGVKDKYLSRECEGDQYIGRWSCVLNHMDQNFSVSPDYFDYSEYEKLGQIKMEKM